MAPWICLIPLIAAAAAAPMSVSIARLVASIGVLIQGALLALSFPMGWSLQGDYVYFPVGVLPMEIGPHATLFLGANIGASLLSFWLGWRQELEGRAFFQHILLTNAAVSALIVSARLSTVPYFWEASFIPLTLGIALWGHKDAARSASRFIGYQLFFGLIAAAALGGVAATTSQLFGVPSDVLPPPAAPLKPWIPAALTVALMGKLGVFPFHGWLPSTFRSIHPSGAIFLVGGCLSGTLFVALRLRPLLNVDWMTTAGTLSYLYCSLLAFRVDNFRALTAALLGAQLALCGVALVHDADAFLLLACQSLIVFPVLGALIGIIENRRGESTLSSSTGMARTTPKLGAFLILFLVATLPMPLLPGFPGAFLLLKASLPGWVIPVIALTLILQMTLVIQVCENLFRRNLPKGVREVKELKLREWWALVPVTFTILAIGAFSSRVLNFLNSTQL